MFSARRGATCLLEAMSCGRAVIAAAVGGIPEILSSGEKLCGVPVAPVDPGALAEAIVKLGLSSEQRQTLGIAARQRIVESFSAT